MPEMLLPTTVVGSYPQPDWLIDRQALAKIVPRTRMKSLWRVAEPHLKAAQDDATLIAIRDMERLGLDVISDGEMRRESYSNHFATALEGLDNAKPGIVVARSGPTEVPRVVGKVRRARPVEVSDMEFLRRNTDRRTKMTLPGPFTMGQQAKDEHYGDPEALAMDLAVAVNEEAHDLVRAGADMIQIDEPWVRNDPIAARRYAVKVIDRALLGLKVPTVIHICFGYGMVVPGESKPNAYAFLAELAGSCADIISIEAAQPKLDLAVLADLAPKKVMLGVLNLADQKPEAPETVAGRIREALKRCPAERLVPAPDCGMKYMSREIALSKLDALVKGAAIVRKELSGR